MVGKGQGIAFLATAGIGLNPKGRYPGYWGLRLQPSLPLVAETTYDVLVKEMRHGETWQVAEDLPGHVAR